jgi:hypothetical protein
MDELISQGKGKVKAVKARLGGLVGVFKTLAEQHGELAALLERLQDDPARRAELWPRVRGGLISHEHSEVRELYPVLRQFEQTRELADHHDDEARELDAMIARLDAMDPRLDAWGALFDELAATVIQHATQEEEKQIFPLAQQVLGDAATHELDAKILGTYEQILAMHGPQVTPGLRRPRGPSGGASRSPR